MRIAFQRLLLLFVTGMLLACKVELHSTIPETDANEIVAHLLAEGISAEKQQVKGGVTVLVDKADFARSVETLAHRGLPRRRFQSVDDIFSSDGLVASPLQEWAKLNFAKSQELSQTISGIPGVVKADVHLGISRQESAFDEVGPPSASVLIQMQKDAIYEELVPEIRKLIDLAHPDITYDRVGVVITTVPDVGTRSNSSNEKSPDSLTMQSLVSGILPLGFLVFLLVGGGVAALLYYKISQR